MKRIIQQLKKSEQILVASHANPDGDALGSAIAMGLLLDCLQKQVTIFNASPIPAVYRFLPAVKRVEHDLDDAARFDTAVILDCANFKRIGEAATRIRRIPVIINIDHHVTNTRFGDYQCIDTRACATAEIVYRFIQQMGIAINLEIAMSLYTGILTDTGSFRFSNTNKAAFSICMQMVEIGVDPFNIAQRVYGTYSLGRIKLLNLALDTIEISENGKLSLMAVTQDMLHESGTKSEDLDGLINYARGIKDIQMAALIEEIGKDDGKKNPKTRFHVSLRSVGDVDVSRIAASFGGGGHVNAAGFSADASLSELKLQIIKLAQKI